MSGRGAVLLFPGQGAQRVGMGADLVAEFESAREVFARAEGASGLPLSQICFDGPETALRRTDIAQPALVATEIAALAAFGEALGGLGPEEVASAVGARWVAGHSLGEYAACVAASALTLEDAIGLATQRGRLMAAAPEGAMCAILGLEVERVADICARSDGVVVIANDNAPGQVVISGERAAVEVAAREAKAAGAARAIALNVDGAFHSPLMADAATAFAGVLGRFRFDRPRVPVIGNVAAAPLESAEALRSELRDQLPSSVRWRETLLWLAAAGAERAIECGPGTVLAGLTKRTVPDLAVSALGTAADVHRLAEEYGGPRRG